jgi:hypothetical protein
MEQLRLRLLLTADHCDASRGFVGGTTRPRSRALAGWTTIPRVPRSLRRPGTAGPTSTGTNSVSVTRAGTVTAHIASPFTVTGTPTVQDEQYYAADSGR